MKKRIISVILIIAMLISMAPVGTAEAAVTMTASQQKFADFFKTRWKAHGSNVDNFMFPNDKTVRASTFAFITTSIFLDTSEYSGLPVEAYNELLAAIDSDKYDGLDGSAFDRYFAKINIQSPASSQTNYLLDTISVSNMSKRYFAGNPGNTILINTDDAGSQYSNKLSSMVGIIMDSVWMNGTPLGSTTNTMQDAVGAINDDVHAKLFNMAKSKGYVVKTIVATSNEDGSTSFSMRASSEADWAAIKGDDRSTCPITMYSAFQPIITYTYRNRSTTDYTAVNELFSLVHGQTLYTNYEYLCTKYSSTISGAYDAKIIGNSGNRLNVEDNYADTLKYWTGVGVGNSKGIIQVSQGYFRNREYQSYQKLLATVPYTERCNDLCHFLITSFLEGKVWIPLNDMIIILGLLSSTGYVLTDSLRTVRRGYTYDPSHKVSAGLTTSLDYATILSQIYPTKEIMDTYGEDICAVYAYDTLKDLAYAISQAGSFTEMTTAVGTIGLLCPATDMFNLSNTMGNRSLAFGYVGYDGKASTKGDTLSLTMHAGITVHNLAPVFRAQQKIYEVSGASLKGYTSNQMLGNYWAVPAELDGSFKLVTYEGMRDYPSGITTIPAHYVVSSYGGAPVQTSVVSAEKTESIGEVTIKVPARVTKETVLVCEDEFSYNTVLEALDEDDAASGFSDVTGNESNKTITLKVESGFGGISKIKISADISKLTQDVIFTVSNTGSTMYLDGAVDNKKPNITVNTIPDKEYTEEDNPTLELVETSNKPTAVKTTIVGNGEAPIKYVFDVNGDKSFDDEAEVKDGSTFSLYEGCSYEYVMQFEELPFSGNVSIKVTNNSGDSESESFSSVKLEDVNEWLTSFSDYIEYYDVAYDSDSFIAKQEPHKWEVIVEKGSSTTEIPSKFDVSVYAWAAELTMEFEKPSTTTITPNTDTPVEVVSVGKIGKNDEDTKSVAHMEGKYKVTHKYTAELEDGNELLLTEAELSSTNEGLEADLSELEVRSKKATSDYTKTTAETTYSGKLTLEKDETWEVKDTVTIEIYSAKSDAFVKVLEFSEYLELLGSDEDAIVVNWDKEYANLEETVKATFNNINLTELGLSDLTGVSVSYKNPAFNITSTDVSVQKVAGKSIGTVVVKGKFTEKGSYQASEFSMSCDGKDSFAITQDNTNKKFPYHTITVPNPAKALAPLTFTIDEGTEHTVDHDKTEYQNYNKTISFGKGLDYDKWVSSVGADEKVTITFRLNATDSGGKTFLYTFDNTFNVGALSCVQDGKDFTITGTKQELAAAIDGGANIIAQYRYHFEAEYPEGKGTATSNMTGEYTYTQDGSTFKQPISITQEPPETFKWRIGPGDIPEPVVFTKEVGSTPQAVLCSTLPSPSKWRWDVMSGIPCTEVMSATVGADVFRVKTSEVAVTYGEPKDDGAFGEDADGVSMTPNSTPAAYREIIFKVRVTDWWGTDSANNPLCNIGCDGHSTGHGCSGSSSADCSGLKSSCSHCGWSVAVPSCNQAALCAHCSGTCDHNAPPPAEGEEATPPTCGGCSCGTCAAGTKGCSGPSNSGSCPNASGITLTWNCETNNTTQSSYGSCSGTISGGPMDAYNQSFTDAPYSWSCGHCGASDSGYLEHDGLICKGYTKGKGCICRDSCTTVDHDQTRYAGQRAPSGEKMSYWDKDATSCKHNTAHPAVTGYRTYRINETVDAVTYTKLDEILIQVLQGAEIADADIIWEDGTEGRTCIIDGASFDIWRGNDDDIISSSTTGPYLNASLISPEYLVQTNRMYFSGFPSGATLSQDTSGGGGYDIDGDGVIEDEEDANVGVLEGGGLHAVTKNYEQATSIYIELDIVANSKVAAETLEEGEMFTGNFSTMNGIEEGNHQTPTPCTAEDWKSVKGDIMSVDEIDKLCTLAVNNWLGSNFNYESTCNTVSDALTLNYKGESINLAGRLWSSNSLKIFNCYFSKPDETIHRSHTAGTSDKRTLAEQMYISDVSDIQGGSAFYTGFTGVYAPDSEEAMYTIGPGAVLKTRQSLVKALGTSDMDNFNGKGTNFEIGVTGNSYGEKYLVESDLNLQGLTSGSATTTGSSSLKTGDEYYGSTVTEVEGNGKTEATIKGEVLSGLEGESLLPLDVGDIKLTDAQLLTFLGLRLKPSTVNGVYEDSLTINALYTTMVSRDGKIVDEFENDAEETLQARFCKTNGNQNTINDLVVINPVANRTTMMGNEKFYSVYETDESHEDYRKGQYDDTRIIIGNPFYVWVSNLTSEASTNSSFATSPSFNMWGDSSGESCDGTTGEVIIGDDGAKGAGKHLNTKYWCDGNTIEFSFPVYYISAKTGQRVYVEAGEAIPLWTAVRGADGVITSIDQNVAKATKVVNGTVVDISGVPPADLPELPENQLYGDCYQFYCCLSAKESDAASWRCYSYGINYDPSMPGASTNQTMYNRDGRVANSIAESTGEVAIVGRIGDLSITDTQDFRFGNVFWKDSEDWLIKDIVKKPTTETNVSLMTKFNLFNHANSNWHGTIQKDSSGVGMANGASADFPLSSSTQLLEEFKGTNLGIGYTAYLAMSTVGDYTGELGDATYPKTVDEAAKGDIIDTRNNTITIEPFYALYDLDTGKFYDIELYAGSGSDYSLFWQEKTYPKNYTNGINLSMDEAAERLRYCVSDYAMNFSLWHNTNKYSAFTDSTYQGTAGMLTLDERSNIVIGTKYEDAVPTAFNKAGNNYTFSSATAGAYTVSTDGRTTEGLQAPADYAVNARRWFTSIGLPSSTVVTYTDIAQNPMAIKASHEKLLKEHPNGVIVCFASITAKGDVFTLEYDFSRAQGSTTIDICGKSVNYADAPVYINDTVSYKLMSQWAPLFVTDVKRTSTQDLLQQGTH